MKSKKGVEMSLTVIIVAVLLLTVLAVLMYLVFNSSRDFKDGVSACSGTCKATADCDNSVPIPMACEIPGSTSKGKYCCKELGSSTTDK